MRQDLSKIKKIVRKKAKIKPIITVSEDDKQLFREATKGVKPLISDKVWLNPLDQKPKEYYIKNYDEYHEYQKRLNAEDAIKALKFGIDTKAYYSSVHPHDEYTRNGIDPKIFRKIRQQLKTSNVPELDLHGYTVESAYGMTYQFLDRMFNFGCRVIKIIHGKGLKSAQGEGILKYEVRKWLIQYTPVLGYFHAPDNHGGHGALIIYLAKNSSL